MNKFLIASTLALALSAPAFCIEEPLGCTIAGLRWERSFDTALSRAKDENKPILLLQMFGSLDDELC